ncbi:MAG: hypothetical protein KJ601_01600 [Nanoarchaeota archaeon]|nr:hypothetical protein [Nanoarchaeota archaeon]MBU1704829.1 hypothetical protein [Nanoarchaeota archaeon]
MRKKSQGLSLNVIIVAALALIVLIVLWAIFTGRMGSTSKELQRCRGECVLESQCTAPDLSFDKSVCPQVIPMPAPSGASSRYRIPAGGDVVCCVI